MKNQPTKYKKAQYGFTLFEIMLVITMIGIFFAATMAFQSNYRNDLERANRLMNGIQSTIRTEILNAQIGKMPKRDGNAADEIRISISTSTWVKTSYLSGGSPIGEVNFWVPYYDGSQLYKITDMTLTGSAWNTKTGVISILLVIKDGNLTFSGITAGQGKNPFLFITTWYNSGSAQFFLDRRSGRIEDIKSLK